MFFINKLKVNGRGRISWRIRVWRLQLVLRWGDLPDERLNRDVVIYGKKTILCISEAKQEWKVAIPIPTKFAAYRNRTFILRFQVRNHASNESIIKDNKAIHQHNKFERILKRLYRLCSTPIIQNQLQTAKWQIRDSIPISEGTCTDAKTWDEE